MNTEVHVDTGIVAWAAAGKAFDQSISSKNNVALMLGLFNTLRY